MSDTSTNSSNSNNSTESKSSAILKQCLARFVLGTVIFIIPSYAIKWGHLHPHINWPKFLQSAWSVGLANSPLAHHDFYTAHFHWQELACLFIYLAVAVQLEYLLAAYGASSSIMGKLPRTKKEWLVYTSDEDRLLRFGTCAFLLLFIASCALCERTDMGTIKVAESYDSMIRDAGIVISTYFLYKAINIVSESVVFNGMVVRTDVLRSYLTVVYSLAGVALAFGSWFPLLAMPGAQIATKWIFTSLRESIRSPEEIDVMESVDA